MYHKNIVVLDQKIYLLKLYLLLPVLFTSVTTDNIY